jgi:hypothetical protein
MASKLLVHFMKNMSPDYETAANGLEAFQKFQTEP